MIGHFYNDMHTEYEMITKSTYSLVLGNELNPSHYLIHKYSFSVSAIWDLWHCNRVCVISSILPSVTIKCVDMLALHTTPESMHVGSTVTSISNTTRMSTTP